jgi:hypothetical protein
MVSILRDHGVRAQVYLRHYWLSNWGVTTKRRLFRAYRDRIEDPNGELPVKSFVKKVNSSAERYAELADPSPTAIAYKYLSTLAQLRATQCLPFLLAISESTLPPSSLVEAAKFAESLSVLYTVFGDRNPNRLEKKYSEWARAIRCGKSLDEVRNDAATLLSGDEIERALIKEPLPVFESAASRFLLVRIAEQEIGGELKIASPKQVHVEHIIALESEDTEIVANWDKRSKSRLGNLTLILGEWNQSMSNKAFKEKIPTYTQSKIQMTNDLIKLTSFTANEAKDREKRFAEIAGKIWSIK